VKKEKKKVPREEETTSRKNEKDVGSKEKGKGWGGHNETWGKVL